MKNKCLSQEEIDDLKQAFDLFINEETEKISPNEIFEAMKTLGLESKNPIIYEFIGNIKENELYKEGINFEEFIDLIKEEIISRESKDNLKRIFHLFKTNPNSEGININDIKKILNDIGDHMDDKVIEDIIKTVSKNGKEITFNEFYEIMNKPNFN
jgi:Ca2+-binding EF-hand superfamily protein